MLKNIIIGTLLCFIWGCATSPVIVTDSDSNYDLSSYKSFKIEPPKINNSVETISINPILIQRIERALETSLESKGLRSMDEADLVVRFYIGTQREVDRSLDLGSSYGYYGRSYLDSRDVKFIRVEEDEISIRFHDSKSDDVVWYAFTRFKRTKNLSDQDAVNSLIEEAVAKF